MARSCWPPRLCFSKRQINVGRGVRECIVQIKSAIMKHIALMERFVGNSELLTKTWHAMLF